jgi:hypothetical protein
MRRETDDGRRCPMVPRILTFLVVIALGTLAIGATAFATERGREDAVIARDEDAAGVLATEDGDDDTGGDTDGDTGNTDDGTSGVDSGDGTNSRSTAVSNDTDRSRGDLTRDRTKDGPGTSTRDRTANQTNDRSRTDTR